SQETRNKQVPKKTNPPALLSQDPTVCQTLNHPPHSPPFHDTQSKDHASVLEKKEEQAAAIC
ncbi:hypothetical protein, partial [Arthrobacter sp. AFG7.2]|uniref:hypothetical protein n=1 Tax=Arthrobacter sp. AFG7.2 TaxID=1688693 RepID=UPI001CB9A339